MIQSEGCAARYSYRWEGVEVWYAMDTRIEEQQNATKKSLWEPCQIDRYEGGCKWWNEESALETERLKEIYERRMDGWKEWTRP